MKEKGKIRKDKRIVFLVLAFVLIVVLVLIIVKLKVFSGFVVSKPNKYEEKLIYQVYEQTCDKDEEYFIELAKLAGGSYQKMREIKEKSIHCNTSEFKNMTEKEFDAMGLECECIERNRRKCQEGWELKGDICVKEKLYTSSLKACSFYECEDNYYVEVIW